MDMGTKLAYKGVGPSRCHQTKLRMHPENTRGSCSKLFFTLK